MTLSERFYRPHDVRCTLSAAAILTCLLVVSGCSDQGAQSSATIVRPDGIINGTLIQQNSIGSGPLLAVLNHPGRGRLEILSGGKVVASVMTGPSGGFRVRVPAGRYEFRLADSPELCATDTPPAPVTFTVGPRRANEVQVFCAVPRRQR